uniref:DNA-directed RNA polymerase subunit n=1 Tax=Plectus sambesii TaxID=2011161 RepID=A0A914VLZ9_9BILA
MDIGRIAPGKEPFTCFTKLQFRSYYPHEVRELSVVKITETKTFDEVGHPIRGGLYDPLMGPNEIFDLCETCHQYGAHCPGHLGHIQLDVPVFNPVLFNFTFQLLKGTCVQCHRFSCNASGLAAKLLLAQLRCIELGMVAVAQELEAAVKTEADTAAEDMERRTISQDMNALESLDALIVQLTGRSIESFSSEEIKPMRNAVEMKMALMRAFTRDHLFKRRTKCPLCKRRNATFRNDGGRCILLDFSVTSGYSKAKSEVTRPRGRQPKKQPAWEAGDDLMHEDIEDTLTKEYSRSDAAVTYADPVEYSGSTSLDAQMASVTNGTCEKLAWRGAEVREHFRLLWQQDGHLLERLFPLFEALKDTGKKNACPMDVLFCELVPVPPTKYRPIRLFKGEKFENPQTANLRKLLEATETVRGIHMIMSGSKNQALADLITQRVPGKDMSTKMHNAYIQLQTRMSAIYDSDLDRTVDERQRIPGIKQLLEKKQGLFRMNMMGKRVNFACRSVITPDPYLDVDEIGIPDIFAKRLTFTEPVNVINLPRLRKLVNNGPLQHPGANFIYKLAGSKQALPADKPEERQGIARRLMPPDGTRLRAAASVLRHLDRGDMMLMNRQPTLHKPSIMGHRARVLKGQRALRMNYAPCKSYNADFDGDEMNGHLVQSRIAQAEVGELATVGMQYLVPKDGTPILGLIQDHVVSGVLLTLKDRFFTKEDYHHLVLAAFAESSQRFNMLPPAMLKPKLLWTGKQVISTLILNVIPKDRQPLNLKGKAKTSVGNWQVAGFPAPKLEMSETEVVIRQGELLCGVMDKAHYGATQYGLVHCCYELYGPKVAIKLLSCFSRLFTTYLQFHGFTLGVADILVTEKANRKRARAIKKLRKAGDAVVKTVFNLPADVSDETITHVLATAYCNPRGETGDVKQLDYCMKQAMDVFNDMINKACVPHGLIRPFPTNSLQLMIQSGAKGTMVNSMQISCGLGQIELEGHRPPVTAAGRTLPSFRCFDPSPRAGGFVDQRFLTGVNPQELFFHTMAGREGLIDTAVKTSRSGYLQRCIIKHLEGIVVHYDSTARDHDNSVIQFRYGEDGMDVGKVQFLKNSQYPFLEDNLDATRASAVPEHVRDTDWKVTRTERQFRKVKKWKSAHYVSDKQYRSGFLEFCQEKQVEKGIMAKAALMKRWYKLSAEDRAAYEARTGGKCPDSVDQLFNSTRSLGALSEKLLEEIDNYIVKADSIEVMRRALYWKGLRAQCDPGENVGLLAAQSIGEPSTQMTLNTFHFAGRGEMNVTLGIPRLREILMTASKSIATPSAQIIAFPGVEKATVERIKRELDRVYLKQLIKKFTLEERINITESESYRRYSLTLHVMRTKSRDAGARHVSRRKVLGEIERRFARLVGQAIMRRYQDVLDHQELTHRKMRAGNEKAGLGGGDEDDGKPTTSAPVDEGMSSDEEGGVDLDAGEARLKTRHGDDNEYEGEDDDKQEVEPDAENEEEALSDSEAEPEEGDQVQNGGDADKTMTAADEKPSKQVNAMRLQLVLRASELIVDYSYDTESDRWCTIVFQLPLRSKSKLDVAAIVSREVDSFVVCQTAGIEKCVLREDNDRFILQTQGINLQAFFKHADVLDVRKVSANDIQLILNSYGVEAAARAIVKEVNGVFGCYGIEVNPRHLTLTADYMTFTGQIQPFSRMYMATSASPLQKMTFETTTNFMRDALVSGQDDHLMSPSARIVMGQLIRGGTGAFDLLMPMRTALGQTEKVKLRL